MPTATHGTKFPRSPVSPLSGVKRLANAVWYRSKAKLKDVVAHEHSDTPAVSRQPHWTLPEILEMIISYLAYDSRTLKACASTCFAWYNVAIPHLHHTLTFRQWATDTSRRYLNPLEPLHELDLLPFVKQLQFERGIFGTPWVAPAIFDSESIQYFGALENLQDLTIANLDFFKFPMGVGEYFGHFSPTLRSVALSAPRGTRRQLLDFFRLFPKLDDVKISHYHIWAEARAPLIPVKGELRGRLALNDFGDEELLKEMIVAFGGMRFTSMDLHDVLGIQLLLEACADTLETVHIHPGSAFQHLSPQPLDFSCNTVLRSLEVLGLLISESPKHARTIREILSTITSPAFSEVVVVFSELDVRWPPRGLDEVLREMYKIKEFRVAFCLETLEVFMAPNLHQLTLETRAMTAAGVYDFLPSPPLVFSRTVRRHSRLPLQSKVV